MNTVSFQIPTQPIACKNYYCGDFQSTSGLGFEVVSPYTGQVIGKGHSCSAEDLDKAVQFASEAQKRWAQVPIKERSQIFFRLREILLRDIKQISERISLECGKTLKEAEAEILKGVEVIEFALSLQNSDVGGRLEVSRNVFCEYRREPIGVVAGITPFNFPAMVPMWMLPIAIILGNAFVWKPSEKTPLTPLLIAEAFREAGLPAGILNVVHGGSELVNNILDQKQIQAVGFVGSTKVAKLIYQKGSQNLKRVLALGGAKNHIIMMPDADPDLTGKGIADSFTGCAGQRCMAASVLLAVEGKGTEELIEGIRSSSSSLQLGKDMGAIISKDSLQRLEKAIAQAEKDGAKVILDGRGRTAGHPFEGGYWLGPTVLDHVQPASFAATEELFGPVLSIIRCKNLRQAIEIQASSVYGNAVSVFTQNGGVAEDVAKAASAGMVGVNIGVPVPREPFSFGGLHESKFGHGDITGVHSLNLWSNIKKVTTKWAPQKDSNWMS